ncbi:hypothetical protein HNV12_01210 [Methanococcoides sp. SA1]|nr:hypothetical protein [Methanococcoides sp. SA1]
MVVSSLVDFFSKVVNRDSEGFWGFQDFAEIDMKDFTLSYLDNLNDSGYSVAFGHVDGSKIMDWREVGHESTPYLAFELRKSVKGGSL